ncbi:MAG TPA: hypothetical protein PKE04_14135, partial [Clostridia bacterium]|nr:hypothetical protein [Clostridia bacterium]
MSNETNRPVFSHAVTPSAAMTPPPFAAMAQRREYPVQPCAPAVHARTWFDAAQNRAGLAFNGCDLITFELPAGLRPTLRFHSDGDFLSAPFTQQAILALPESAAVRACFQAPVELW